jgi:23S rRNA (pseudouridine1915-N3)-methyltransferase
LQELADGGVEGVLFAIGSDLGLHQDLLDRADEKLSLGPMTLPHLLARLPPSQRTMRDGRREDRRPKCCGRVARPFRRTER